MSRHGAILDLGGPGADHHFLGDEAVAALIDASTWHPQRPARTQTRDELAFERAAALHVQSLVDRLMADPHRCIVGEIEPQPIRDLLRAPRLCPAPILSPSMAATDPAHRRTGNRRATRVRDHAGQPLLHVHAQRLIGDQLGDLRPPRASIGVPLRGRRAVLELSAPCGRVAPQLARDRRRRTAQTAGDLANAFSLRPENRDLLTLGEGEVAARERTTADCAHPTSLTEPSGANRLRQSNRHGGILASRTCFDRIPEPLTVLTTPHRRTPWRTHRRPPRRRRTPTLRSSHAPPPRSRCCNDQLNPPWLPASLWCTSSTSAPGPR